MSTFSSKSTLFKRALILSLNNVWRNKVLSLATIFVIGIIIFIFNILFSVNFIANNALTDLSKKVDIIVYLKDSTTFVEAQDLIKELNNLEGIENITFTSKDDALAQIKQTHPNLSIAFEKYNLGNPLPASLNITTTHPKYHQAIIDYLSKDRFKGLLSNLSTNEGNNAILESVSKNLLTVTDFTNQIIFWLVTIFIIGGALIILNALQITIFARRKEIEVMKLVGASYWFIRLPFLIESVIYGSLAFILSFIMIFFASNQISIDLKIPPVYFILELLIALFLAILSSQIAVHEHLFRRKF